MTAPRQRLSFACFVAVLWGCGGGTPAGEGGGVGREPSAGGGEPAPPVRLDPAALCAEVIALQCEGHLSCCRNENDRYGSLEECKSLLGPLCVQDLSGAAYTSGRIAFDGAAYVRALETLRRAVGACEPIGRDVFAGVFEGTLGEGDACTADVSAGDYSALLSCAPGLACVVSGEDESAGRVCAPRAAQGEACLDVECADGLHCAGSGRHPTCQPLRAEGIGCASHAECATGYCGDEGRCAPRTVAYRYCEDLTYP